MSVRSGNDEPGAGYPREGEPLPNSGASAGRVLNAAGVRLMRADGETMIGIWSDLDSAEIRQALQMLDCRDFLVRYLDGAGVPARYKLRRVGGNPTPSNVLAAMEAHPDAPWEVRDHMLNAMKWHRTPIPLPADGGIVSRKRPINPKPESRISATGELPTGGIGLPRKGIQCT